MAAQPVHHLKNRVTLDRTGTVLLKLPMPYVTRKTLSNALSQLHGTAGHLLKIWLVLKHMGLSGDNTPVTIDTANSTPSLKRLFSFGDPDGRLFVPFAHTPRFMTMKGDASRSIIQTTLQRWATSDSVVTCDPTSYLDVVSDAAGKISVSPSRRYPLGLGHGQSGFALEDDTRVEVPLLAFAVWYGRQTQIPDDDDAGPYLTQKLTTELNLGLAERSLIFKEIPLDLSTAAKPITDTELFALCSRQLETNEEPKVTLVSENLPAYQSRVEAMVSNLGAPPWLRRPPIDETRRLIADGCKSLLLYGPPRTGKTRIIDSIAPREHASRASIQIHDGWTYDNLVQGFRPDNNGGWTWTDGPLLAAIKSGKKFIVLEEINRTNISQALGEVFSLIEDTYRGKSNGIRLRNGEAFWIPEDCVFLFSMNTVDKSTEEVDDALLGRISSVECPPRSEDLMALLAGNGVEIKKAEKLARVFAAIQHMYPLGHGYFASLNRNSDEKGILRHYTARVRPVLQNHLGLLRKNDLEKIDNIMDQEFSAR